ncbi:DUF6318 family protein [Geodermatophilus sp. CPCC 205761]|uniref:DUF6318 family protein n=1 Tax=Geodermatophilus sp. CPCC 205761 TaxID=2936597 RepID=UPI003EEF8530
MDDVAGRATLRLVAGMTIGVALLGGCAEEQPASDTLPAASAEAEPSDADLPPLGPADFPVPPKARDKTPDGALEFTRYYIDLNGYIATEGQDPQPLIDLSENCKQCQQVAESYSNDRASGYSYDNFTYSFTGNGPGLIQGDTAQVGFVYEQGAFTVVDSTGNTVNERSAAATGELQSGTVLQWDSGRNTWLVTELTIG